MKLKEFINEWNNIDKIKIFEVPVIDKRTNEPTFIIFDIQIIGRSFLVQFEPLTIKQSKSKKIAHIRQAIDLFFSLDMNLQELYSTCINELLQSEYFELNDN